MATPPFFLQPVTCNLIPIFYSNISSSISIIGFAGGGVVTDGAVTGAAGVALFSAGAVGTFGVADEVEAGVLAEDSVAAGVALAGSVATGAAGITGVASAGSVTVGTSGDVAASGAAEFAGAVAESVPTACSVCGAATGTDTVSTVSTDSSTGYSSVSSVTSFFDAAVLLKWLFSLGLWPKRYGLKLMLTRCTGENTGCDSNA